MVDIMTIATCTTSAIMGSSILSMDQVIAVCKTDNVDMINNFRALAGTFRVTCPYTTVYCQRGLTHHG